MILTPCADGLVRLVKLMVRAHVHYCRDRSTGYHRTHNLAVTDKRCGGIQLDTDF